MVSWDACSLKPSTHHSSTRLKGNNSLHSHGRTRWWGPTLVQPQHRRVLNWSHFNLPGCGGWQIRCPWAIRIISECPSPQILDCIPSILEDALRRRHKLAPTVDGKCREALLYLLVHLQLMVQLVQEQNKKQAQDEPRRVLQKMDHLIPSEEDQCREHPHRQRAVASPRALVLKLLCSACHLVGILHTQSCVGWFVISASCMNEAITFFSTMSSHAFMR